MTRSDRGRPDRAGSDAPSDRHSGYQAHDQRLQEEDPHLCERAMCPSVATRAERHFRRFSPSDAANACPLSGRNFRNDAEGREEAEDFAGSLADTRTLYIVRTRVEGRVVTETFKRYKDAMDRTTTIEADKLQVERSTRASRRSRSGLRRSLVDRAIGSRRTHRRAVP